MKDFRNEKEASFGLARQYSNDWKARQGRGHAVYSEDISAKTLIQALGSIVFGTVAALAAMYWVSTL